MATSIVLIKKFQYRSQDEEWSNRYFLTGADPANDAAWNTLEQALVDAEKAILNDVTTIVRAYGYTSDSPTANAVWTRDRATQGSTVTGTFATTGEQIVPGDVAGVVRWKTARSTSKGKPIYLRKFYHGMAKNQSLHDQVDATQLALMNTFATLLGTGAGVDGRNIRGPGQASDTILASQAMTFLTTRTLKRRGKRPTSAP